MISDRTELYQALAELAYAIAMADGVIQSDEKRKFKSIIRKELREDAWIAESRFDILDSAITPSLEGAYDNAIKMIRHRRGEFDAEMKEKFLTVISKVADAFGGPDDTEVDILEKLKTEFENLEA